MSDDRIAKLGIEHGDVVLDIGFRGVEPLKLFSEAVGHSGLVQGVDVDTDAVDRARAALDPEMDRNIRILEGSILELPQESESVDVVLCRGVLHEVRELYRALGEIYRVLRPNGHLAIADFVRFPKSKFHAYRLLNSLRGRTCLDVWPGFTREALAQRLRVQRLTVREYEILEGELRMGFIRSPGFLLLADRI